MNKNYFLIRLKRNKIKRHLISDESIPIIKSNLKIAINPQAKRTKNASLEIDSSNSQAFHNSISTKYRSNLPNEKLKSEHHRKLLSSKIAYSKKNKNFIRLSNYCNELSLKMSRILDNSVVKTTQNKKLKHKKNNYNLTFFNHQWLRKKNFALYQTNFNSSKNQSQISNAKKLDFDKYRKECPYKDNIPYVNRICTKSFYTIELYKLGLHRRKKKGLNFLNLVDRKSVV